MQANNIQSVKSFVFSAVLFAVSLFCGGTNVAWGDEDVNGMECELVRFEFEEIVEADLPPTCKSALANPVLDRAYIVCIPSRLRESPQPVPLVLAFHGGGGTAALFQSKTAYEEADNSDEFVVAYPNGCGRMGHKIGCDCIEELDDETGKISISCDQGDWNSKGGNSISAICKLDDERFVAEIVSDLSDNYGVVDRNQVYAVGYSAGGMFSYRLACESAETLGFTLAAIGPTAATLAVQNPRRECTPPLGGVSIFHVHNLQDANVPFQGGGVLNDWPAVTPGLRRFADANACTLPALPVKNPKFPRYVERKGLVCAEGNCVDDERSIELCLVNEQGNPADPFGPHKYAETYDPAFKAGDENGHNIRDAFVERFIDRADPVH